MNFELCVAGLLAQVRWDVMTSFCKLISGSAMTHLADVVSEFTVTTPVLYLVSVVGSLSSELDSISLSLSLSSSFLEFPISHHHMVFLLLIAGSYNGGVKGGRMPI